MTGGPCARTVTAAATPAADAAQMQAEHATDDHGPKAGPSPFVPDAANTAAAAWLGLPQASGPAPPHARTPAATLSSGPPGSGEHRHFPNVDGRTGGSRPAPRSDRARGDRTASAEAHAGRRRRRRPFCIGPDYRKHHPGATIESSHRCRRRRARRSGGATATAAAAGEHRRRRQAIVADPEESRLTTKTTTAATDADGAAAPPPPIPTPTSPDAQTDAHMGFPRPTRDDDDDACMAPSTPQAQIRLLTDPTRNQTDERTTSPQKQPRPGPRADGMSQDSSSINWDRMGGPPGAMAASAITAPNCQRQTPPPGPQPPTTATSTFPTATHAAQPQPWPTAAAPQTQP